jgi:hypothetical protein
MFVVSIDAVDARLAKALQSVLVPSADPVWGVAGGAFAGESGAINSSATTDVESRGVSKGWLKL